MSKHHMTGVLTRLTAATARLTCLCAVAASMAACGDMFEFNNAVATTELTLDRTEIDMMVGDRYVIPRHMEPDSLTIPSVFWKSDDDDVVSFNGDTIIAKGEGTTMVTAISVSAQLEANCTVNVWPRWYDNPYDYPYDMVIYADVTIDGEPLSDDVFLGAFIGGQLRGVAQTIELKGHRYTVIRVWSNNRSGDIIFFRHYDPATATMKDHTNFWIPFSTESQGMPSAPYEIVLN